MTIHDDHGNARNILALWRGVLKPERAEQNIVDWMAAKLAEVRSLRAELTTTKRALTRERKRNKTEAAK